MTNGSWTVVLYDPVTGTQITTALGVCTHRQAMTKRDELLVALRRGSTDPSGTAQETPHGTGSAASSAPEGEPGHTPGYNAKHTDNANTNRNTSQSSNTKSS